MSLISEDEYTETDRDFHFPQVSDEEGTKFFTTRVELTRELIG